MAYKWRVILTTYIHWDPILQVLDDLRMFCFQKPMQPMAVTPRIWIRAKSGRPFLSEEKI